MALDLMEAVWPAALARVEEEVAEMQAIVDADGGGFEIAPWDYRYYMEKVRQAKYELNSDEVKQYLQLDKIGERIVVYFDNLGGLEGQVTRITKDGFAMEFAATVRRRQKLAAQITWLINQKELDKADLRRPGHERINLQNLTIRVQLEDGETEDCDAIDVSISGASLESTMRPRIGSQILVGKLRAKVARHHDRGFGVAFVDIQRVDAIRRYFG